MIHLSMYHHCLQVLIKTLTIELHDNPEVEYIMNPISQIRDNKI